TLPATATFNMTGDGIRYLIAPAILSSGGPGTWSGTGQLQVAGGSALVNNGTLTVSGDATVLNYTGGSPQFTNNGTLIKTAGTNTLFLPNSGGMAFNNNGVLNAQSGIFSLGGGGAGSNGTFTAGSGAQVALTAGNFTCAGTSTYSGPGLFCGGNLAGNGGTMQGTSVFTGTGTFNWTGGQIGAVLTLPATATFNMTGDGIRYLIAPAILSSGGPGAWSGTGQ